MQPGATGPVQAAKIITLPGTLQDGLMLLKVDVNKAQLGTGLGWGREGATLCFAPPIPPILLPIEPQNTQNPQPRDLRGGGSALWQGQRSEVQLSHPTAASCPCPASDLRSRECKGVGRRGEQCDGVREESGCPRRCRGLQHPSEQGSRPVQKGEGRSCEWVCVRERT